MIAMQVANVTLRNEQSASVLLVDDAKQIRLRFGTTYAGGEAILAALQQTPAVRPLTQTMLLDVLHRFDIRVCRAAIDELRGGLLFAHLELQSSTGKSTSVDALPSDVVSVALRTDVPLEVAESVVAAMGSQRGQLIDVGGYQLSAHVKGRGIPVVVLESAFGGGHELWSKVQDSIAEFTTVCSDDRAGLGWSDSVPGPRTFRDSVRDLHALLQGLTLPAPYVLVGHSIGGPLVLLYASTYAADMAGLVLVDSSHPDQRARFLAALPPESTDDLPGMRTLRKNLRDPALFSSEWNDAAICFEQAQACGGLGHLPLSVITATRRENPLSLPEDVLDMQNRVWVELQQDLARLSSRSTQRVTEDSGHFIQLTNPNS